MTHSIEYGLQEVESLTNADLDKMKAAGARWVRILIDMSSIYPTSLSYTNDTPDYSSVSSSCTYAQSIGLQVLGVTAFVPDWLQVSGGTYPSSPPNDYDKFATMCARAYRDLHTTVNAWEIWNEPNIVQFWLEAGSNTYRNLLRQAVIAMRTQADIAGNWSDPFIINAGPASSGSGSTHWTDRWDRGSNPALQPVGNMSIGTFLDYLFDNTNGIVAGTTNGTAYLSSYAIHAYVWGPNGVLYDFFENPLKHAFQNTITVGSSPYAFWDDIVCVHESYGTPSAPPTGHKRIWATESGWPGTTGLYTTFGSEAQVAADAETIFTFWELFSNRGAGPHFWFPLHDGTYGDEINLYGGLFRADYSVKPVRATFRTHALNYADNSTPSGVGTWSTSSYNWSDPRLTWDGGVIGTGGPIPVVTTKPVFKIELGLPPTRTNMSTGFVLNGTRGHLNNTTYTLAPDTEWFDISNDVAHFDTSRGRNRELDVPNPGTATIEIRNDRPNTARDYDPSNTTGPYYPELGARRKIRISVDGIKRYTGLIENFEIHHTDFGKTASVTLSGVDSMVLLNHEITYEARHSQTAVQRLNYLLDLAEYHRTRFLLPGVNPYDAKTEVVTGSAWDDVTAIAQAERGFTFVTVDDVFVFIPFDSLAATTPALTISDNPSDTYRYSQIDEQTGTELLYNKVVITSGDPTPVEMVAADLDSIGRWGVRSLTMTLPLSAIYAQNLANELRDTYGTMRTRFRSIVIHPARLALIDRQALMRLDIGSVITVKRTPLGTGSPTTIQQDVVIIGIADQADANGDYTITFTLQWRS